MKQRDMWDSVWSEPALQVMPDKRRGVDVDDEGGKVRNVCWRGVRAKKAKRAKYRCTLLFAGHAAKQRAT